MEIERFEKIKDLYLVKDKDHAVILKEGIGLSKSEIKEQFDKNKKPLAKQRSKLLKTQLMKDIKIKPFELKSHFLSKGMLDESNKAIYLNSDNALENNKQIKNELSFFGNSFMEGFLEVFGVKINNALEKYERNFLIIEEENINTGIKESFIVKCSKGIVEKATPAIDNITIARKELDTFLKNQQHQQQKNKQIKEKQIKREIEED